MYCHGRSILRVGDRIAIISEVGAVMMVGGNIAHRTRVLTSAIVLETSKGNFELAMALGLILISISSVNSSGWSYSNFFSFLGGVSGAVLGMVVGVAMACTL